jgi:hypothetical protein
MASDEITSVGHVTLETYPVYDVPVPTSPPPVTADECGVPHDETREDTTLPRLTFAEAPDQEELPWMTLAKWRKHLVLVGYVASLVTRS